jgi:3-oxoadipate enol-lactonase
VTERRTVRGTDVLVYDDDGQTDGPTVVLLHGAGYAASTFAPATASLADAGWRVLRPDMRGAGRSTGGMSAGPAALVDDVLAVLADAGVDSATVVGHSLGGWTALGTALRSATLVTRLVLVGSPAGIFTPAVAEFWSGFEARLRDGAPPEVLAAIGLLRTQAPALSDVAALGHRIPVTFVVGADDPVYPPSVIEAAASAVPGAAVTVVPGAGHHVHLDAPAALLAAISV